MEVGRRAQWIRRGRERMEQLEARLLQVDERFLDGDLEGDSYRRLKDKDSRGPDLSGADRAGEGSYGLGGAP